jgi:hypothetical protein
MPSIAEHMPTLPNAIFRHEEQTAEDWRRTHLGASLVGHHCQRYIWLSYRWAIRPRFDGRMLRLLRRGHEEERRVIATLLEMGVQVTACLDRQRFIRLGDNVAGSPDGLIVDQVLHYTTPHLLEIKTHSDKSFRDLQKNGVQKSKPQHWNQMQVYMSGTGTTRAFYLAVNKNDDAIYEERVRYDATTAKRLIATGDRISYQDHPPPKCSENQSWYQCKMCDAHGLCHKGAMMEEVNCRTCAFSTPKKSNIFHCDLHAIDCDFDTQKKACDMHVIHPELTPWPAVDVGNERAVGYDVDGDLVVNGEDGMTSVELILRHGGV